MSKSRIAVTTALIACSLLLWWSLSRGGAPVHPEPVHPDSAETGVVAGLEAASATTAVRRADEDREVVSPRTTPEIRASEPPAPAKPDRRAREEVDLVVQDEQGHPIANAEIRMVGLRRERERGSHYGWPEEPSVGRTGADGRARLWFPVWTTDEDRTAELTFRVEHPDFVAQLVDNYEPRGPTRVVVLEQGALLAVSGWIGSRERVIVAVVPHLSDEARLGADAWIPRRDGRLTTAQVAPGRHAIWLEHRSAEHGILFSVATEFEIERGEQKLLELELLPAARLEGELEAEVPRPVVDGEVELNLCLGTGINDGPKVHRTHRAPISPDGRFVLAELPPGEGEIVALCDGWVSERERLLRELGMDRAGSLRVSAREEPQRVERSAGQCIVKMERTSTLVLRLRDTEGAPAAGARVQSWPNVRWSNGYSSVLLDREWSAISDERGEARLENLPRDEDCWIGVEHASLDLPRDARGNRALAVALESGRTHEVEVALERKRE